jgi:hypothetical protein
MAQQKLRHQFSESAPAPHHCRPRILSRIQPIATMMKGDVNRGFTGAKSGEIEGSAMTSL